MLATKIYVGAMLNIQNDKYFDGFCYDVSKTLVNPKKKTDFPWKLCTIFSNEMNERAKYVVIGLW